MKIALIPSSPPGLRDLPRLTAVAHRRSGLTPTAPGLMVRGPGASAARPSFGAIRLNSPARSCRRIEGQDRGPGMRPGFDGRIRSQGGGRMRRRAVVAGCCFALGLAPGCAAARLRHERSAESPAGPRAGERAQPGGHRGDGPGRLRPGPGRPGASRRPGPPVGRAPFPVRQGRCSSRGTSPAPRPRIAGPWGSTPNYVGALVGLGQIDAQLGRPAEALKRFEMAIEVDPHQAEAHFARGQTLEALGRPDDALAAYFRSLELNPASTPTIVRVAALQLGRDQADQALVRLDQAVEIDPEDPEVRFRRGLAQLALKRPNLAVADLAFAAGRQPERPDVLFALAQALEADHKPDQARRSSSTGPSASSPIPPSPATSPNASDADRPRARTATLDDRDTPSKTAQTDPGPPVPTAKTGSF